MNNIIIKDCAKYIDSYPVDNHYLKLIVFLKDCQIFNGESLIDIQKNDILLTNPKTIFKNNLDKGSIIKVLFNPSMFDINTLNVLKNQNQALVKCLVLTKVDGFILFHSSDKTLFLIENMKVANEQEDAIHKQSLALLLQLLFIECITNKQEIIKTNNIASRIINDIEQHYHNISLSSLSEKYKLNKVYISNLIKQESGFAFKDFITNLRLEHSKIMLETTSLSVENIANLVGINNLTYFYKLFEKKFSNKPSYFRTHNKKQNN